MSYFFISLYNQIFYLPKFITMKKTLIILSLAFLISSCNIFKKTVRYEHQKFLPAEVENLYLGMTLEDFLKEKPYFKDIEGNRIMSFRITYSEEGVSNKIKKITYYFDAEGEFPLYEFILEYYDAAERDRIAAQLLGEPNYNDEWLFDTEQDFKIQASTYMNKLIIVGKIEGTEWDE